MRTIVGALVAAVMTGGAAAAPLDAARGERLLAEARAACGGTAWDRLPGWHERGHVATAAGSGTYEDWAAITRLAMALRTTVGTQPPSHAGIDGAVSWRVLPGGGVDAGAPLGPTRLHRRDAYLTNFGYFQPQRYPATVVAGDPLTVGATVFDVVTVQPAGAEAFALWIDRASHHVARIVVGQQVAELRDYRTVAGVCAPTVTVQSDGNPAHTTTLTTDSVEAVAIPPATFAPPPR